MKINKFNFFTAGIFLLFLSMSSCLNDDESVPSSFLQDEESLTVPDLANDDGSIGFRTDCGGMDLHWEYEGMDGPDHWGDLCPDWACDGMAQSPVNIIPPPTRKKSKSLYFYWKDSETHIVNNGHTVQYNYDQPADLNKGSYLTLNGAKYHLLQFHFHALSEHTVNGEHFPIEIHFVHKNMETGKLAVIGVFVEEGDENPFFGHIADEWPHDEGEFDAPDSYNANVLMPEFYNHWLKQHFWWYGGSLTTPPCSEIVSWFVMMDPIHASSDQIHEMEDILHENYRPVQPLNSRLVKAQ